MIDLTTPAAGPDRWRNWAGNQRARGITLASPSGTDEIAATVAAAAAAGRRVRALGSGHSPSGIGRPDDVALALDRHAALLDVDGSGLVTVQAGMPLHRLTAALAERGWALTNLGDIDRQTVAGALSTGTHGTGAAFGVMSTAVRALELVTGEGAVRRCSPTEDPALFAAARVGLGALGVLTAVTLQAVPAFALRAQEGPARLGDLLEGFGEVMTSTDHVEFHWFPHTGSALLKRNTRVPLADGLDPLSRWRAVWDDEVLANAAFGAVVAAGRRVPTLVRPLARVSARALGPRTWTDASHRVFVSRRRVRFVESEYALPREAAVDVLTELRRAVDASDWRVPFPVEVRLVAADDIPLSPASGRDSAYVAVHLPAGSAGDLRAAADPEGFFAAFEAIAAAAGGRPHWGKLHTMAAPDLAVRYPRFEEFGAVRARVDPAGTFAGAHLTRVLGPVSGHRVVV